jgi:hypothetical protein
MEIRKVAVWKDRNMAPNTQNSVLDSSSLALQEELRDRLHAFYESLVKQGVIVEPNPPIQDFSSYEDHRLIEVKGKPLSQDILEARR